MQKLSFLLLYFTLYSIIICIKVNIIYDSIILTESGDE